MVGLICWIGVDIDEAALEVAREAGLACVEMDFTSAINFQNASFDVVMMTEVLEHLPYPAITVREVHRILKKNRGSAYVGSVPLDYHLHRRWKVMRGKRLSGEQLHVHHFSFKELDQLLRFYFDNVERHGAAPFPLETPIQSVCSRYCLGGSFTQSKAGLLEYKGKVLSY